MPRLCCVDGCRSRDGAQISFFRFPRNETRCQRWKKALDFVDSHRYAKLEAEQCNKKLRVCDRHFSKEKYMFNNSRTHLLYNAVPSLNLQKNTDGATFKEVAVQTDFITILPNEDDMEFQDVCVQAEGEFFPVNIKSENDVSTEASVFTIGGIEECKKKWSSVRDQLRRTIQKRKRTSGQGAVKIRKYKYEDTLEFLLPHILERDTPSNAINYEEHQNDEMETTNIDVLEELDERTCQLQNEDDKTGFEFQNHLTDSKDNTKKFTTETSASSSSFTVKKDKVIQPSPKRKMNREGQSIDSPANQLLAYILAEKEEIKRMKTEVENTVKHPVDAFLSGIAPTLKSLDPIQLNQAKSAIFNIVQEFEMRQLEQSSFDIKLSPPSSPQFDLAPSYSSPE